MGAKLTDEKQLWEIEGDCKEENKEEKIKQYKQALIRIGKWKEKS